MSKYFVEIWFSGMSNNRKLGKVIIEAASEVEALALAEGSTEHWVVSEK